MAVAVAIFLVVVVQVASEPLRVLQLPPKLMVLLLALVALETHLRVQA